MNLDIEKLKDIFKDYPCIASAYLFGSQATEKTGPMSDVDIAVLLKEPHPHGKDLIHAMDYLAFRIEEVLNKEVDIVELNRQRLIFQHNVLRTGKLIHDAEPAFRIGFEMRVISNFCDFEPTLRFMRKYSYRGRLRRLAKL